MHAHEIVAYTYKGETYSPDAILPALNQPIDGWTMLHPTRSDVEILLSRLATSRGINRAVEETFDSEDFPKVVFGSMIPSLEMPMNCGAFVGYKTFGEYYNLTSRN